MFKTNGKIVENHLKIEINSKTFKKKFYTAFRFGHITEWQNKKELEC